MVAGGEVVCAPSGLPPALLAELLPVALQLLRNVLRRLCQATTAGAGTSSSSSSTNSSSEDERVVQTVYLAQGVANLLQGAALLTSRGSPAASGPPKATAVLWQQHAAALMPQLQELLRLLGQLPADGKLVESLRASALHNVLQLCCCEFTEFAASSAANVRWPAQAEVQGMWREQGPLVAAATAGASSSTDATGRGAASQEQRQAAQLQQQLFGLMSSALKLQRQCASPTDEQGKGAGVWVWGAMFMLRHADAIAAQPAMQQQVAAAAGAGATAATTPPLLPWLVLASRCCLLWAEELQAQLLPADAGQLQQQWEQDGGSTPGTAQAAETHAAAVAAQSALGSVGGLCAFITEGASKLMSCFAMDAAAAATAVAAAGATTASASAQQLVLQAAASGLGISTAAVQALLLQLVDACAAADSLTYSAREAYRYQQQQEPELSATAVLQKLGVTHEPTVAAVRAAERAALASGGGRTLSVPQAVHTVLVNSPQLAGLLDAMQALGSALCGLPIPHACNNPRCTNLARHSEQALVDAPGTMCGGCHNHNRSPCSGRMISDGQAREQPAAAKLFRS
jgi:hypothetical protein